MAITPVLKGRSIVIPAASSGAAWTGVKRVNAIYANITADICVILLKEGGTGGNEIASLVATDALDIGGETIHLRPILLFAEPQDIKDLFVTTLTGAALTIFTV